MSFYIDDSQRGGVFPFRDHDVDTIPDMSTRIGVTIVRISEIIGTSEEEDLENAGNWECWQYWEQDPEKANNVLPQGDVIEGDPEITRKLEPAGYMRRGNPDVVQRAIARDVGAWMQCTPVAVGEENGEKIVKPIHSKIGGLDKDFKGKKFKTSEFDGNSQELIKPIAGSPVPGGFPGVCVQGTNSKDYENFFVPAGHILSVDHKSDEGSSTRVLDTQQDGFIDVSNKEAAGLHSAWKIFKNERNEKVVAITGNKSGKDSTGHGAIVLNPKFGEDDSVPQGVDLGKLCYLSSEMGGILTAGSPSADNHRIGLNQENKEIVPAHIDADIAKFYKSPGKDGAIKFTDKNFPIIDGVTVIESDLIFDPASGNWRILTLLEEQENLRKFARIRWNFAEVSGGAFVDLSEGQIVDIDGNVGEIELVWIDYRKSSGVFFNTAGNSTIFQVRKIAEGVRRDGATRDLYLAETVIKDEGQSIRYVEISDKQNLAARLLSGDAPWLDPNNNSIKTQIGQQIQDNFVIAKIPQQWDIVANGADYKYLEVSDLSRGIDVFFSPICPTPVDKDFLENGLMESAEKMNNETPIATYKLKVVE